MNASTGLPETRWYARPQSRGWRCDAPSAEPGALHRSMPGYEHTPLVECPTLADELEVGRVFVKDESGRFGLSAFKMLGASWAVFRAVGERAGGASVAPTLAALTEARSSVGSLTLTTATDGNHGRAVARMATLIGASATVYIPREVDPAAISLIESEGADVVVLDLPYDDVVRASAQAVDGEPHAVLIQDTSWSGYERVPQWIVDGYSTLFVEIDEQLTEQEAGPPSVVTVPTGVGSLAQAAVAHHRSTDGDPSAVLIVEPESAPCVGDSLRQGGSVSVTTGETVMDGLNCGTPSSIAWPYLRDGADAAIVVSDADAERAQRDLAAVGVASGPCGASSLAAMRSVVRGAGGHERREELGLDHDSTVVLLSTDGRR